MIRVETVVAVALAVLGALCLWLWLRQRALAGALRDTRAASQALQQVLDVWQWRTDAEHRLVHWRPPGDAPAAAWGRAPAQCALWDHVACADAAGLRTRLQAQAEIDGIEVAFDPGDGRATGELRGRPLADAEGRFIGHVGTLRRSGGPGGRAAGETESDAESFSYTVSHDLRAPIRVVEGFTRILKEDYGRLLDRVGNDHLERVLGAATRMNSMIDALLALAQLSSQPLASQPVNLSQLAGYIADDLRRQEPERNVRVTIEPGMQVRGDPTLLRMALENLLGNAWKYTAKAAEPQIWFGRSGEAPGTVFTLRDNGAGFDMRFADRLFGMFQRLHSASEFHGTGVGLASVRRIVRRHGGDIWAEGEVGVGSSFHFTLGG